MESQFVDSPSPNQSRERSYISAPSAARVLLTAESDSLFIAAKGPHNKEGFRNTKAGPEGALFIKTKRKRKREKALNAPYESLTPHGAGPGLSKVRIVWL